MLSKQIPLSILTMLFSCNTYAFDFGIGLHPKNYPNHAIHYVSLTSDLGFNSVRTDYSWGALESQKNIFSISEKLKSTDHLFKYIKSNDRFNTLLVLDYGNKLHTKNGYPHDMNEILAFANYVNWVSSQYAGNVKYYEIWNEWLQGTGVPGPVKPSADPNIYYSLAKESYNVIKKNDPSALVLIGSINPTIPQYVSWSEEMIKKGILKYADGISIHSYTTRISDPKPKEPEDTMDQIDIYQKLVAKLSGRIVPLYITEMGYPTMANVPELSQYNVAQRVIKFSLLARSKSYIKGIWWYDLINDGDNKNEPEQNYGFLNYDGSKKYIATYIKPIAKTLSRDDIQVIQSIKENVVTITVESDKHKVKISWIKGKQINFQQLNKFINSLEAI